MGKTIFYRQQHHFHKTVLSDLQGAWSNLKEEVVNHHPFEHSDRILFQIDEAMSWESVHDLEHMGNIILIIHNTTMQSKTSDTVVNSIRWLKEEYTCVLDDIATGKTAFHPMKARERKRTQYSSIQLSKNEQKKYTENSPIINWQHPSIMECSEAILSQSNSAFAYIKNVFGYVRDIIRHSRDFQTQVVTCVASEVLKHKSGSCYAKSHLLAALLRAQTIPVGFCYQRLSRDEIGPPYCLHGLNAVFLEEYDCWYRVDARGNKEGVNAQFTPPVEQLAFPVTDPHERDLPEIWSEPLPVIVQALQAHQSVNELYKNLPDIQLIQANVD